MTAFSALFSFIRNGITVKQNSGAGGLPITRIETISDGTVDPDRVGYAGLDEESAGKWILQPGDILFSHINSPIHVGKVAMYTGTPHALVHGMNLLCLRPDPKVVDARWALHLIRSAGFRSRIQKFVNKAVNQASISIGNLGSVQVDVPPLDEQRRIAVILDRVEAVKSADVDALDLLDELICSVFVGMFGDPMKRTPVHRPIGEVCQVITGNTPSRSNPLNYGGGMEWIKSDNLGGTIATEAEERISPAGKENSRIAPAGSILVTCIAGSPNSIGKCSLVDREVAFNQQINAAIPGAELNGRFLLEQLKVAPNLIRQQSTGGMKGLVSKSNFMAAEVQVPPLGLQQEFARIAGEVDRLRQRRESALAAASDLRDVLSDRAFAGEL